MQEVKELFMLDAELEYCMLCGKANPPDREICECGNKGFILGSKFTIENNKVVCDCGSDEFMLKLRINRDLIYDKTYECHKCGNLIGIQHCIGDVIMY